MRSFLSICTLIAVAVSTAGCCDGPLAYTDCILDSLNVNVVDESDEPVGVEAMTFTIDGGEEQSAECYGEASPLCERWYVAVYGEGDYEFTATLEDQQATTSVDVVYPEKVPGECCSDVFYETIDLEVPWSAQEG